MVADSVATRHPSIRLDILLSSLVPEMSSAAELIANDPQLQTDAFKAAHEKYSKIASAEVISATQSALKAKGYASVFVAQNGAEALEAIKSLIPDGSSVHNTSSISLVRIALQGGLQNALRNLLLHKFLRHGS